MILDANLEFSDAQSIASLSSTSTQISTNVSDLGANGLDGWDESITLDIGEGGELEWNVQLGVALVGASAAMTVTLVTKAASATITTSGNTIATLSFPALSTAGTKKSVKVPSGTVQRYLGVIYTAVTGNVTSSTWDSWVGTDHPTAP